MRLNIWVILAALLTLLVVARYMQHHERVSAAFVRTLVVAVAAVVVYASDTVIGLLRLTKPELPHSHNRIEGSQAPDGSL
jgi:hypothetical protein